MAVLGLIPARGGSKGIHRKNIRTIAGKPLLTWTIEVALKAKGVDAVVVSTDDEEIAEIALSAGAMVPFMRPAALAADDTPGVDPVLHALGLLPQFNEVLLLQPTSPLRTAFDIEGVLALGNETGAPSIVTVCESEDHPDWMYRIDTTGRLEPLMRTQSAKRRQDLPDVYTLNGAIYYARSEWLRKHRSFLGVETLGYLMPMERSIDIDNPLQWQLAELFLLKRFM
jgi:CMP-N-acetylneuraminic acid synthetase